MSTPFLQIKDLHIAFHLRAGVLQAVSDLDLTLDAGETLGIVGESGSGKSVTAKSIVRLNPEPPAATTGQIFVEGESVFGKTAEDLRQIRGRKISMIFQEPMTSLNPVFTIGRQMTAGMVEHLEISRAEALDRAADMLTKVGIPSPQERLKQFPHELSGGMRQRVMLATALSCNPTMLIADEPTTALDVTIQAQILDLLAETVSTNNMSLMLISHDLYVIADTCERIIVMYAGRPVESGPTSEVLENPVHPYTIGLKESQPKLDEKSDTLIPIPGRVPNMLEVPPGCPFHPRCKHATESCKQDVPELKEIEPGRLVACPNVTNDQL